MVSLVLCFAMLLGTTFAWFTDTASTSVNKIQAGTLNVALLDEAGNSLEGKTLEFVKAEGHEDEAVLWEPGATYNLQPITIKNNGNLALKYEVIITGIEGSAKLNEAIEWTIGYPNGDAKTANANADVLKAGETAEIGIEGHMKEDAGNEYQGLSIEGVSITVLATQASVEYDSNNNVYDSDATYYDAFVSNTEEFLATLNNKDVTSIVISNDITYDWGTNSYENANNLVMEGKIIRGLTGNETITFESYGSANNIKNVTLENIKVADKTVGDTETAWEHGYLEFNNLTAINVEFVDQIQLNGDCVLINCTLNGTDAQYAAWVNSGNATFNNCTVQGIRSIKVHEAYGSDVTSVTIEGCMFTTTGKPGVVIGDVDSTTSVVIKNNSFVGVPAGDQGKFFYESDTDVATFNFKEENNTNLVNGSFISDGVIQDGTSYAIYNANGMFWMAEQVANNNYFFNNKTIKLIADIDLANRAWTPVGTSQVPFAGTFDGNGYTIKNLNITEAVDVTEYEAVGLFNWVGIQDGCPGYVKNVTIDGATVSGSRFVGAVVGYLQAGSVENCTVKNATVIGTHKDAERCGDKVGAVIGFVTPNGSDSKVSNCKAENCEVKAGRDAGQVIGMAYTSQNYISGLSATNVTVSATSGCTDPNAGQNLNNTVVGRQG